jgi:hypothetical protein
MMPRFADYHRTVVGYHGTRKSTAHRVIQNVEDYKRSENNDDWLGHGIYFWEYAPKHAWPWADQRQKQQNWGEEVAVLAAMIRLGNCFDLLDPDNVEILAGFRIEYEHREKQARRAPMKNHNKFKYLDCAVFQLAYAAFDLQDDPVDTCRAVFVPSSKRLWTRSGVYRDAHIQLCVRNPECILGSWLVKPLED